MLLHTYSDLCNVAKTGATQMCNLALLNMQLMNLYVLEYNYRVALKTMF